MIQKTDREQVLALHQQGFNNTKIAEKLGVKSVGHISTILISYGIRKQESNKFSDLESQFIKDNFQSMGDKELAQKLTEMGYPRTFKMIEKFRYYKNFKRSESELREIRKKHQENGVWDISKTRTPEAIKKKSESLRKIWKREKWRQINGLSPITRLANRKIGNRRHTKKRVLEIRSLQKGKLSEYARNNNMSISAVWQIYNQKTYRDVHGDKPIIRVPSAGSNIQYGNNALNL